MDLDLVADAVAREQRVEVRARHAQPVDRDERVARGQPGPMRGAAFVDGCERAFRAAARARAERRLRGRIGRAARAARAPVRRERHAERLEEFGERQIARAGHRFVEKTAEIDTRRFGDQRLHVVLADALRLAVVEVAPEALPQKPHHVVERFAVAAARANRQIERERDERALRVIADDRVRRVFVLPVILDPRIERAFGDALPEPAGAALHAGDRAADEREIVVLRDEAAAREHQVVVVRREALEEPQQRRVILLRQIVRRERGRLDPLHVPCMEVLVAAQAEVSPIAVRLLRAPLHRQIGAIADERRRRAMLEPAVAVADRLRHEHVARHRRAPGLRLEQRDLRLAHPLQVGREPLEIEPGHAARDRDVVRHAVRVERREREFAERDRMIDQLVVILRAVRAEAVAFRAARLRQRRRDAPAPVRVARRPLDHYLARRILAAERREKHARAVEEAARVVQVRGAHRQVPRVDVVAQRDRPGRRRGLPGLLVELADPQLAARFVERTQRHDIARELAHHIAARNPYGQREALARRVRIGERERHLEQVRGGIFRNDRVANRLHRRNRSGGNGVGMRIRKEASATRRRLLRDAGNAASLDAGERLIQFVGGYGARQARAVGEEYGRRARHVHSAAEREVLVERGRVAVRRARGRAMLEHPRLPAFHAVARAPDRLRLHRRIGRQHRIQERVDGHVVDRLQRRLELLAVRAVRIGEHRDLARAVALHDLDRVRQRQAREIDLVDLGEALGREVLVRLRVDELAEQHVIARCVAIDDLRAEIDLVQTRNRRLRHALDRRVGAEARLQRGLQLVGGLVGLRGAAERRRRGSQGERGDTNRFFHANHPSKRACIATVYD
ncbi:hypothetical protein BURPS1710b_3583 [Burkholderia pseudomallei 1710b]|uniref:Uncharacterized protein n=1 Tax=Burkholderia pseudomallei (strain 1710b) TaxID=320372 RepID=Q3JNA5_BURP1|nr:hypothetical protein BURPS1710b_3583 [Burkholderia pseudomallei 1710b]